MSLDEAVATVREVEKKEHRCNGAQRGRLIEEAFETLFIAVESLLDPPRMGLK